MQAGSTRIARLRHAEHACVAKKRVEGERPVVPKELLKAAARLSKAVILDADRLGVLQYQQQVMRLMLTSRWTPEGHLRKTCTISPAVAHMTRTHVLMLALVNTNQSREGALRESRRTAASESWQRLQGSDRPFKRGSQMRTTRAPAARAASASLYMMRAGGWPACILEPEASKSHRSE